MSIRIDYIRSSTETVVNIAGRLSGDAVAQLKTVCDTIEANFIIDLSSLKFADQKGIDIIRAIRDEGARIRGASPFIELLIENSKYRDYADWNRNKYFLS